MPTYIAMEINDAHGKPRGVRHINLDNVVTADTINPTGVRGAAEVTLRMVDGTKLHFSGTPAEQVVLAITEYTQEP